MKSYFTKAIMLSILAATFLVSCRKTPPYNPSTTPSNNPPPVADAGQDQSSVPETVMSCDNRHFVNARLVPIGSLSEGRMALSSAAAGSKIVFAGGSVPNSHYSARVDIYDTITMKWSTAELSKPERQGMAVATVGNKIFFAGGGNNDDGEVTSRVDIYDASTNAWSTAELSKAREYIAATTLGNKIFFSGGGAWEPHLKGSRVIDIYDNATNKWSVDYLSEGRMDHTATTAGNKIYFAGGTRGYYTSLNILKTIDIYDATTNSWSTSSLAQPKSAMASIAVGNKIFWGSGMHNNSLATSNQVEIRDLTTGVSSFACMLPRYGFSAVVKDDNIVFFAGINSGVNSHYFDIYNTKTNTWSTGVLEQSMQSCTVISVNNTIYVAGGTAGGGSVIYDQVWKLEF